MSKYSNIRPAMTLKRFTEQVETTAPKGIDFYLGLVKHDVNNGYFIPMEALKQMSLEPNYKELEVQLFDYLNDKNAVVNEKYEQDKIEEDFEIEVIQIGKE